MADDVESAANKEGLAKSMALQRSPPLKGILKKPKQLVPKNDPKPAASDDEQIRRINFQHTLQMMHEEKKNQGFFPEANKPEILTSTAPQNLGISLLRAAVTNRTGEEFNGPEQEVVLNAQPTTRP
jgi:hypothetical protein